MNINDSENQFATNPLSLPDDKNLIIIVGGNNSGKSTLLRSIVKTFGADAYRVDVNRTILKGEGAQNKSYLENYNGYASQFNDTDTDNFEKNIQTLQDFFQLKDTDRIPIIGWYNKYFPNHIYEERENPENSASPMFLKVNGYPITKQGSGMRATMEIFIKLFDPNIKILCVDEPELGLEPFLQKYLFRALKDKATQEKKIIIATHSHHFLDYEDVQSNYKCERNSDGKIYISAIQNLKSVIFRLLGNSLSSFLLPEKVLILEGPSDTTFINKFLDLINKNQYAIHGSGGSGNVTYAINSITQFLKFNEEQLPVYKDNIYVVVDKPAKDIVVREWEKLLGENNKICTLEKNGIEYYYPERILQNLFDTTESVDHIVDNYLRSPINEFNGVRLSKTELAKSVAQQLTIDDISDNTNQLFEFINQLP
jgi:predicted ATP-dependent endonuclease of OLD family